MSRSEVRELIAGDAVVSEFAGGRSAFTLAGSTDGHVTAVVVGGEMLPALNTVVLVAC